MFKPSKVYNVSKFKFSLNIFLTYVKLDKDLHVFINICI